MRILSLAAIITFAAATSVAAQNTTTVTETDTNRLQPTDSATESTVSPEEDTSEDIATGTEGDETNRVDATADGDVAPEGEDTGADFATATEGDETNRVDATEGATEPAAESDEDFATTTEGDETNRVQAN